MPTISLGSGSQLSSITSTNSGPPTTINQVITGINSTVESLGLNASAFASSVIMIFPNASTISLATDGKLAVLPSCAAKASLLASPTNDPEQSFESALQAHDEKPSVHSSGFGVSENFSLPSANTTTRDCDKEQSTSSADNAPSKSSELLNRTKRKRLKRGSIAEELSDKDFAVNSSDLDDIADLFHDIVTPKWQQELKLRNTQANESQSAATNQPQLKDIKSKTRRGHECSHCGMRFSRRTNLNDHLHSHEGVSTFEVLSGMTISVMFKKPFY